MLVFQFKAKEGQGRSPEVDVYLEELYSSSLTFERFEKRLSIKEEVYMTVDKVSRLITALGGSSGEQKTAQTTRSAPQESSAQRSDAVKLGSSFGASSTDAAGDSVRRGRVEDLKRSVRAGTYNPDTTAVAESIARELFT